MALSEDSFTREKRSHLKKDMDMMVVFDVMCVQDRGSFVESDSGLQFYPNNLYNLNPKKMAIPSYAAHLKTIKNYPQDKFEWKLDNDPCIQTITNNLKPTAFAVPNDPLYSEAAHLDFLNAPSAWDTFYHATAGITQDVVIAVIDSGGDFDHPDLIDNVWTNPGEVAGNNIDDDGNGYIDDIHGFNFVANIGDPTPQGTSDNDHGTNVAGAAAARMGNAIGAAGIMGLRSKIMHLNIAGPGELSSVALYNSILYATSMGVDVMNLSLGYSSPDLDAFQVMTNALQAAVDNNVFVVAAAGNDGLEQTSSVFSYPGSPLGAQIEGFINVGSIDTINNQISNFSNFSDTLVEIMAPGSENSAGGVGIFMPDPGSDPANSYDDASGTSFASPIVAGAAGLVIGLLRSRGQNPTPAEVEQALKTHAVSNGSLSGRVQNCRSLDLNSLAIGL